MSVTSMQCSTSAECGGCRKRGSRALCVENGCACTLPKKTLMVWLLVALAVVVVCTTLVVVLFR